MKKKILVIFVLLAILFVVPVVIYHFFYIDNSKISDGKYFIQNCPEYPNAYIEVKDGKAKFSDIDLNDIYQDHVISRFIEVEEGKNGQKLSDKERKELVESINLNQKFCSDFFEIEYDILSSHRSKYEYTYIFSMITEYSGLQCTYDYHEKRITVENEPKELVFQK